jgi:hypothetical protein
MATNCEFVASVSAGAKKRLHSNSGAASAATIKNFTGAVKADDLPLAGLCLECRGDVARVLRWGSRGLKRAEMISSQRRSVSRLKGKV